LQGQAWVNYSQYIKQLTECVSIAFEEKMKMVVSYPF
jgi:hypothetical protein